MITAYCIENCYPQVEIISEKRVRLLSNITISVCINGRQSLLHIHKGFESDGASFPMMSGALLGLHPLHSDVLLAAIVHDYIYRNPTIKLTRLDADDIFRLLCKCNKTKRRIMWIALRVGGLSNFKKR